MRAAHQRKAAEFPWPFAGSTECRDVSRPRVEDPDIVRPPVRDSNPAVRQSRNANDPHELLRRRPVVLDRERRRGTHAP